MGDELSQELALGLVALLVALYGLAAGWLSRHSVSAAFAFVAIGAVLGGAGLGIATQLQLELGILGLLAELTLALVLFSAASTLRVRQLDEDGEPVLRLLAIGLVLTVIAGTVVAIGLFPGISLGLALIIGATLAPTDADLGHQVVSDRAVPARVRRLLNVESGLNDGIAAPVLAVGLTIATMGDLSVGSVVLDILRELGLATLVGLGVGLVGSWLLGRADAFGTSSPNGRKLAALAIALGAYLLATGLESSGFIAAFVAGLAFGIDHERAESAVVFSEVLSVLLSIVVWLSFGLLIVDGELLSHIDLPVIAYALLALTLLRMVPVALALAGDGFDRVTVAFVGWFGPRGLASIVFALLALETLEGAGLSTGPLLPIVAVTIALSVVLHGFSARPLAAWYGRYARRLPAAAPEFVGMHEPRRRGRSMAMPDDSLEP